MAGIRKLRSWFFSTTGDTPVGGFFKRLRNGSKPNQQTFENLCESAAFHAESSSAAQTDTATDIINKQGLAIAASDARAKAGNNTPLGDGLGMILTKPSQLPTVQGGAANEDSMTNLMDNFVGAALDVTVDPSVTTRNNYIVTLTTEFKTWFINILNEISAQFATLIESVDDLVAIVAGHTTSIGTINTNITSLQSSVTSLGSKDRYVGTSTTSNTIGTGNKSFTANTGLSYSIGVRIRLSSAAGTGNYMEGNVASYNSGTGALVVTVDTIGGSGTFNDWLINIGGVAGISGDRYKSTSTTESSLALGVISFEVGSGYAYAVGNRIRATDSASGSNFAEGHVISYSGGVLTINADKISGSGSISSWNINLGGNYTFDSWQDFSFGSDFSTVANTSSTSKAQYRKDNLGNIEFRGQVIGDSAIGSNLVATLPVEYRPANPKVFPVVGYATGGGLFVLVINANGEIQVIDTDGTNVANDTQFYIDNVKFNIN